MNIYEVNKIMSNKTKARIITHFWDCTCCSNDVNNLVAKLGTTQSNISKHLNSLKSKQVLDVIKKGREKYYLINKDWKKQWKELISTQMNDDNNKKFVCNCKGQKCEQKCE